MAETAATDPLPGVELFELTMLGGGVERRYRRLRPEVEALPWGTLHPGAFPEALVLAARQSWTEAAFQEHRTGAACAATLQALICARAPLDLIATATRFPLDELTHVEMCARLAGELGGGTPIGHDPSTLVPAPKPGRALAQAADMVVRFFCVGEAISIPLLRGTWHAATHPLVKGVLGRIVKDEAAHGAFGWQFLDWALPELTEPERAALAASAAETIALLRRSWERIPLRVGAHEADIHALGWMNTPAYLQLARASLVTHVLKPLAERGLHVA